MGWMAVPYACKGKSRVSIVLLQVTLRSRMGQRTVCAAQWLLSLPLRPCVLFGLKSLRADSITEALSPTPVSSLVSGSFSIVTKSKLFLKTGSSLLTIQPEQLSPGHGRFQSPLHSCLASQGQPFNFDILESFKGFIMENFNIKTKENSKNKSSCAHS